MTELRSAASLSALLSAAARAAHELLDEPPTLISDPDARAVCGLFDPSPLDYQLAEPNEPVLATARISTAARSRFARTALAASGLGQCVLLGAGLDTSVYRGVETTVWLVDRPEVIHWRSTLFDQAAIHDPGRGVPADLAQDHLLAALTEADFAPDQPAFIVALGLVMYLAPASFRELLAQLAGLPCGSKLVFDTILPRQLRDSAGQRYAEAISGSLGGAEPWKCTPGPDELADWLTSAGWEVELHLGEAAAVPTEFWKSNPGLQPTRLVEFVEARRC